MDEGPRTASNKVIRSWNVLGYLFSYHDHICFVLSVGIGLCTTMERTLPGGSPYEASVATLRELIFDRCTRGSLETLWKALSVDI